jgi:hypothetical protein
MLANYTQFTQDIIATTHTQFMNEGSLSQMSHAAYYLILMGTIAAIIAFMT